MTQLDTAKLATPILHAGDHLDAGEFLRRWERMPDLKHAELIDGRVLLMSSPVSVTHGQAHYFIIQWLGAYQTLTPGLIGLDNATTVIDEDNVVQPDVQLNLPARAGGRTRETGDRYITGSPDLVIEIAHSSESKDVVEMPELYRKAGVREYLVWRTRTGEIDWWVNPDQGNALAPIAPDSAGVIHSTAFPGLCMKPEMLRRGDLASLAALVRAACESNPAHHALRDRLNKG